MPLSQGIREFESTGTFVVDDAVMLAFYDKREYFLQVLRDNPDLIENPYPYAAPYERSDGKRGYLCPGTLPDQNLIHIALAEAGLLEHGASALSNNDLWQRLADGSNIEGTAKKHAYAEGYALIDVALYVTFLVNIYFPNRALIQNLIATHVQEDALGRSNYNAAIKAVERVVKRTLNLSDLIYIGGYTRDVVSIAKHDATHSTIVSSARPGIDFEQYCRGLLEAGGFEVQTTPSTGDYGADLIVIKDGLGYAIQCKDTAKPVGVKAVQEAVGARRHYSTDYAVVCCSGGFTEAAVELATSNKVMLCNADQLVRRLDAM